MRVLIAAAAGLLTAAAASAQQFPTQPYPGTGGSGVPVINPSAIMPNVYNPVNQPLSPYLNLLRGGNAGVNYYYGVRPGTVAAGFGAFGGAPFVAGGGNRPLFFPQLAPADPSGGGPGAGYVLPPAGHPAVFNNTGGYFPSPFGQAGGARTGVSGVGATPRPRTR
ncbi:MAG: hypothetical protein C0501_02200 [Isosphaera sp.]|nr:hypothetical protein [Isosphaera sp.]